MQVRPEQLASHLARGLKPVYLVSGDEPLQFNESLDAIRAAAREQGFAERTVLDADTGFDWSRLAEAGASLSLFAERRLIELRLPSGRPGAEGGRALAAFAAETGPTSCSSSAPAASRRGRSAPNGTGRSTGPEQASRSGPRNAPPFPDGSGSAPAPAGSPRRPRRSRSWRTAAKATWPTGPRPSNASPSSYRGKRIEIDDVLDGAAHGARFNSFDLVDATLAGNAPRALLVLAGLAAEGEAPPAIIGALAWQVRTVIRIGRDLERGAGIDDALRPFPAWRRRRGAVAAALRRSPAEEWGARLADLARLDAMSKGADTGDEWDGLRRLVLDFCGLNTVPVRAV